MPAEQATATGVRELHDRLGAMIDQIGQPDYSLRELVAGLREVRDVLFALSEKREITPEDMVNVLREAAIFLAENSQSSLGTDCQYAADAIQRIERNKARRLTDAA